MSKNSDNLIASATPTPSKRVSKKTVGDDAIGSNISENTNTIKDSDERKFTVAIYSTKNVVWEGVGKVSKGYNIVTKAQAEKWLTIKHVRLATPEEVAQEFGL